MDDNRLSPLKLFVSGVVLAVWLIVLSGDAFVLWRFEPQWFQRLASVWAVVLLIMFGLTRYVFAEIEKASSGEGAFVEMFEEKLNPVLYSEDKGWSNYMSKDGVEYEQPLIERQELSVQLKRLNEFITMRTFPAEMLLGIKLALQGGYGDLFASWLQERV